ncbi:hypothetical protein Sme01_08840 [Sphaerisporangium melleum]|uniref:Novel STAND NTPase 1 domain-containing protein n=1 Tax=Sphaerisporangium melleum TaxID=321316 RepID=A0A917VFA7_9ACTN|nr:XRE family transcriptional regulator [Sphaerisporangium melleum]GGK71811.1 hypothetical protein GCM10007964_13350 [Sphaerisporangium melleum]GII68408.1 hypothetical protein Sme01_08840 [Sphaerisporangium melleum]
MGRPERELSPDTGPLHAFAFDLRRLREAAGRPSYRRLSAVANFSVTALSEAAGGNVLPSLAVTLAYVRACGGDVNAWEERWRRVTDELAGRDGEDPAAEVTENAPYLGLATFGPEHAGLFFGRERLVAELCARLADASLIAVFGASGAGKSSLLRAGLLPAVAEGMVDGGACWQVVVMTPGERPVETLSRCLAALAPSLGAAEAEDSRSAAFAYGMAAPHVPVTANGTPSANGTPGMNGAGGTNGRTGADATTASHNGAAVLHRPVSADGAASPNGTTGVNGAGSAASDGLAEDGPAGVRRWVGRVLAERPEPARLLVLVDQFEEVFTLCRDDRERARFVSLLVALGEEPRARVVLGVRADFYAHCAEHADLVAALRDRQVLVGPMEEEDLRRAITGPAGQTGCKVAPELVDLIVAEAGEHAGALPLISHTLLETWRRRRGTSLTLAGYRAAGGVRGAIAATAERVHDELPVERRPLVRRVMLRLIAPGDGTEDTRRRARHAELTGGPDGEAMADVLDRLIGGRLVTADHDSVTIAHEALIRTWPRLRSWLAEDRELLRAHRKLTEAAAEWEQHGRDPAFLYRGARLAGWEGRPLSGLNDVERAFLAAGRAQQARERGAVRRRVVLALAGLTCAVVAVSVLAAMALVQAGEIGAQRDLAVSRQLAAESRTQAQFDPERALRQARRAYAVRPTLEAETALRQALIDDRLIASLPGPAGRQLGVAWSRDGARVAATSSDGTVRVWTRAGGGSGLPGGPPLVLTGHRGEVWSPAFSPDGRRLATAGQDGTVRVWALDGGVAPLVLTGHEGRVWSVAFSPDGRRLASAGDDGTVRVWNAGGGRPVMVLRGHDGPVLGVAWSPDGRRLAGGGEDGTVRLWNADGGRPVAVLRGHGGAVKTVRFSPDGTRVASAGAGVDGTARVWPAGGDGEPVVLRGHDGTVEGLDFSPDGHWLATTSDDATVRVWSTSGAGDPLVVRGHQRVVWSAAFSPDGARLVTAGEDGTVRVWSVLGGATILRGHRDAVWSAEFLPDGRHVVSGGMDGTVGVWDVSGGRRRVLRGHDGEVLGVTAARDGRHVASAGRDGTVRVWDLDGEGGPVVLRGHKGLVWTAPFSPDGRHVATAGIDGTLRVWPADGSGPALVREADADQIRFAVFSPDGRHIATGGADGTVRVWDVDGRTAPVVLRGHQGLVWAVAFSPDGRRLASAGTDGTVRVWPLDGRGAPVVHQAHQGMVWYVSFSPDGRWVASSGHDATVRLWRPDRAGGPLTVSGFGASVESVSFAPDSRRILTTHDDGTVRVWDCAACAPVDRLLQQVDRGLASHAGP